MSAVDYRSSVRSRRIATMTLTYGGSGVEATGLELFTTTELIGELMRRKTFYGVVVHAVEEHKNSRWKDGERTFAVHHNANLTAEEAARLLDAVADNLHEEPQ